MTPKFGTKKNERKAAVRRDKNPRKDHHSMSNEEKPTTKLPGPIHDRLEYERRLHALPPGRREMAQELTRYADTCQYFEQNGMEVPPDIRRAVLNVSKLPDSERAAAMREVNQQMMEYLHDVGEDDGVRH
jgi:hypothetical protein